MEYARRTDYGERAHDSLRTQDLAPVLRLLLQAVEESVTFGGGASIQDLAKLGCPGALLSVVEMQVKKAAKKTKEHVEESDRVRLERRPTTNPRGALLNRKTTTNPTQKGATVAGQTMPTTMSVFSVRRVKVLGRTDTHVNFRVDGITGDRVCGVRVWDLSAALAHGPVGLSGLSGAQGLPAIAVQWRRR
ncbi:MAG: hypothetical protein QF464_13625, partial [Myxococcota bacterium]|nr:hypothetical protein [Myxococcota bacterium]